MQEPSQCECQVPGIPEHLHANGRSAVREISSTDSVYLWHKQLAVGEFYGKAGIPGCRVGDQSVNSHELNPHGDPTDVLFNVYDGGRLKADIARLPVAEFQNRYLPNEKSRIVRKLPCGGTETTKEPDVYTLYVKHLPEACMFPHCEIKVRKGDVELERKDVSDSAKTMIRKFLGELANRSRMEMVALVAACN